MTPDQENLTEQTEEIHIEDMATDYYDTTRRVSYKKPIIITGIIILVIISFFLYRWISPSYKESANGDNVDNTPIGYNTNILTNSSVKSQHKVVNDYLETIKIVNEKFNAITEKVYDNSTKTGKYEADNLKSDLIELEVFKEYLTTSGFADYRLNNLYLRNIDILEEVLQNIDNPAKEVNLLFKDYSDNTSQIKKAMMEFLESNKIKYNMNDDGIISYYILK